MALEEKLYANQFERNIVGSAIKSISNKWTFYILMGFDEFHSNNNLSMMSMSRFSSTISASLFRE